MVVAKFIKHCTQALERSVLHCIQRDLMQNSNAKVEDVDEINCARSGFDLRSESIPPPLILMIALQIIGIVETVSIHISCEKTGIVEKLKFY